MSQFFGQQQLAAQYFRPQYLHGAAGAPVQDGRSGYWRLFYTQLQEDSLKKDEERKRDEQAKKGETQEGTRETAKAKPVRSIKPKPIKVEAPPVKRRPMYTPLKAVANDVPFELLRDTALEINAWITQFGVSKTLFDASVKAANDEVDDEDETLLLLLAA